MKIAYVLDTFPVLTQTFILNEIVELIKRGHDIQIFSLFHPSEDIVHEEVYEYKLLGRTHYFTPRFILRKNPLRFTENFVKAVLQSLRARRISRNELIADAQLAYFATIMEEKGVELIHAHFAGVGTTARRLSEITNFPYTFTTHAFDIFLNVDREELKKNIEKTSYVLTISQYNKDYLLDLCGREFENKIKIVHCGIDIKKFSPKRKEIGRPDNFRILTISRLVEKKGIPYLIEALFLLKRRGKTFTVTIVGDGPQRKIIEELIQKYELENYFVLRGYVKSNEVINFLSNVHVFVLPCIVASNGDRDGIPVALIEAMAMEVPVISTNVSGIPELIKNKQTGLAVQEKDVESLAHAIEQLMENKNFREELGKNGRKKVIEEFNIKRNVMELIKIFKEEKGGIS
jgi:glycosyltransferase involved in cell wall biosynthesis